MKRALGLAAAFVLVGTLVAPPVQAGQHNPKADGARAPAPAAANLPPVRVDDDHDGIDDNLEQHLAEEYAPVIFIQPNEPNYPVSVDWFLNPPTGTGGPALWFTSDGFSGLAPVPGVPMPLNQQRLIGPNGTNGTPWVQSGISTIDRDPPAGGFMLSGVPDGTRKGSLDPRDWTTYVHVYPTGDGGIAIQYWHLFAYNEFSGGAPLGIDNHDADWDANIQVILGPDLLPVGAYYARHQDDAPGHWWRWDQLHIYQGTHPLAAIESGGHGAYIDQADCERYFYEPLGQNISCDIVYGPTDPNEVDNPNALLGTVWKTWTGGQVVQRPGVDWWAPWHNQYQISPNSSPSGGIVNIGEYNPVKSGVGRFYTRLGLPYQTSGSIGDSILNDQVFIEYSGWWGSGGDYWGTPPRGPVDHAWYDNSGVLGAPSLVPAIWPGNPWCNPAGIEIGGVSQPQWCTPPTTSLVIGGPSSVVDGVTYVTRNTTFALTPTQNAIAVHYGPTHTFYRFYRSGDSPPAYSTYVVPFSIPAPVGQITLDYYTLDGLNNAENDQTRTFSALTLTSLSVTPASPTVAAGLTQQFTATGTYNDRSIADISGSVKWASSTPGAATIRAGGLARGVSPGTSTISATLGSVTGSTLLTVGPAEPLSVSAADTVAAGNTTPVTLTFANVPAADLGHLRAWITCGVPTDQAPAPCPTPVGFTGVPGSTTVTDDVITFANQTQNPDGSYSGSGTAMLIVSPTYTGPAYLTFTDEASGIPVGTNIAEVTIAAVSETLSVSATGALAISTLASGATNPVNLTFAHVPAAGIGALNLTLVCGTPTGPLCGQYRGVPGSTTVNGITIMFANTTQNPDGTYSGSGTVMYTTGQELTGTAFAKFVDEATRAEAWDPFFTHTTSETLNVTLAPTVTDRGEFPVTLTFDDVPAADIGHLQAWLICGIPTGPTPCGGYRGVPGDTTVTGDTITFANLTQNYDGAYSGSGTVMYHAPTTYLGPSYMTFFDMTTGDPVAANSMDFTIAAVNGQTITFVNPGNQKMTASPLTVSATASSGLPVTLTSTTLPVCTVSGLTVTFLGPGTCTLAASQAGDQFYNATSSVTRSFKITRANQTITFVNPGNQKMTASPLTVSATASSGLPVTLTSTTLPVCTVSGLTVTFLGPGTCTLAASQAGDQFYNATSSVTRSFKITRANQTITFVNPGNQKMTASPLTVSATASSGLPVTLTSTTLPVCTVSGLTVTFLGPGTCTLAASQAGDQFYNATSSVTRSFKITRANQTITFVNPGNQKMTASPLTVSATASSGLPVTLTSTTLPVCTVSGLTVTFLGPGTCTLAASQAGDQFYNATSSVTRSFKITRANQT